MLSSRIRLARNTTEYPFSTKISADEGKNLVDRVFECISDSEYADGFELKRMNGIGDNQRQLLYEQQEINRYMAGRKDGAAALSHDGGLSIMVNSEDHIRIQAMISGMDMEACLKSADMYDDFWRSILTMPSVKIRVSHHLPYECGNRNESRVQAPSSGACQHQEVAASCK